MKFKLLFLFVLMIGLGAGCGVTVNPLPTPTLELVTATLPPTPTQLPTVSPLPPTAVPTLPPTEGTTTTQLNVRSDPSTGGATLGMLAAFSKVQIVAKDASGNWYQVLYEQGPGGKGWLKAQYVQVAAGAQIPILGGGTGSGSAPNGTVIQQVNIRSGPGTDFNSLGTLNPQDGVTLTGKNSNGTWLQIEFAAGPDGRGWVTAAYVQTSVSADLPIVSDAGQLVGTGTPTAIPPTATPTLMASSQDSDSASTPAVSIVFSPSGSSRLQYTGDVSSPQGDAEDWVQFTPYLSTASLEITCVGNGALTVELWQNGQSLPDWKNLACGEKRIVTLTPGQPYLVRILSLNVTGGLETVRYTLIVSTVR